MSAKGKVEMWSTVDPIGSVAPAHHTPLMTIPPRQQLEWSLRRLLRRSVERRRLPSTRTLMSNRQEFFRQAEGKIPRLEANDPAFMTTPTDVFEALPEELDVIPDNLSEPPRPRIAPTKRAPSAAQGAEEQDPTRWRRQRFEAQGRARDRGTDDDDDQRPGPREMPPPQVPPACRVTAREETRLPHR